MLAAGFWLLLHPEKWEWLAALQKRVQKWKHRTAKGIVIGCAVLAVLNLLLLSTLPDWVVLVAAVLLLAVEMAVFLLYFRCPKCGRVQSPASRHCCSCGEPFPGMNRAGGISDVENSAGRCVRPCGPFHGV